MNPPPLDLDLARCPRCHHEGVTVESVDLEQSGHVALTLVCGQCGKAQSCAYLIGGRVDYMDSAAVSNWRAAL
jgi:transcription elongation factor Elf1